MIFFLYAEVDGKRLYVPDVKVAVGFGREAHVYFVADRLELARGKLFVDNLFDEVRGFGKGKIFFF